MKKIKTYLKERLGTLKQYSREKEGYSKRSRKKYGKYSRIELNSIRNLMSKHPTCEERSLYMKIIKGWELL